MGKLGVWEILEGIASLWIFNSKYKILSSDRKRLFTNAAENIVLESTHKKSLRNMHYIAEITRYANTIKYIFNKTVRNVLNTRLKSFNIDEIHEFDKYLLYFIIYRILWEGANYLDIESECFHNKDYLKIEKGASYSLPEDVSYKTSIDEKMLSTFIKAIKSFDWNIALKNKSWLEKISIQNSIPTFFIEKLKKFYSQKDLQDIIYKINKDYSNSNFTIRIAGRKSEEKNGKDITETHPSKKTFLDFLIEKNIKFQIDNDFSALIHIPNRYKPEVIRSKYMKEGKIFLHDKSSYVVSELVDPQDQELIWDVCSAPGVKAIIMGNKHALNHAERFQDRVICNEFNFNRLLEEKRLKEKYSAENLLFINGDGLNPPIRNINFDKFLNPERRLFDKILIDAPCTGSGTLFQNPELKWRQNPAFLRRNTYLQHGLLNNAINYLKPGGILVYSVCSLYAEEGEYQIKDFLNNNQNYKLIPLKLPSFIGKSYRIDGKIINGTVRTFQNEQYVGSFFYACFKLLWLT